MKTSMICLILLILLSCGIDNKLFLLAEGSPTLDSCIVENDFTVFCYIDSTDCTFCSMKWLDYWAFHEDDMKSLKIGVALIVRSQDEKAVFDAVGRLSCKFPVVFDKTSIIKQNNPLILNQYYVFAVNRAKEVVWFGSPLDNEETWDLFTKTLQKNSK